jgi:hypothetical protein
MIYITNVWLKPCPKRLLKGNRREYSLSNMWGLINLIHYQSSSLPCVSSITSPLIRHLSTSFWQCRRRPCNCCYVPSGSSLKVPPSELPPLASATSHPILFHRPVPADLWRICHCQEIGCSQDTIRYSGLHNGLSSVGRSPTTDVLYLLVSSSTTGRLWVASVIGEHGICWANL